MEASGAATASEQSRDALTGEGYKPDLPRLQRFVDNWGSLMEPATRHALLCRAFYDSKQITDAEMAELRQRGQPIVVMNRVKPAVNGIVGIIEKGRTDPRGVPRTPVDEDSATLATDTLRYIADVNRYQTLKSRMFLDMLIAGWTGSITEADEDGEIVVTRIRWEELIWDPASRETDGRDARWVGIAKWVYVDDLIAQYPDQAANIRSAFSASAPPTLSTEDRPFGGFGWVDINSRRVLLVEMYHREAGRWYRCKFIRSHVIEAGESAYRDKKGRSRCPIEIVRAYVDSQNKPYGVVTDMLDPQREINARRSWLLRALVVRQAKVRPGGVADIEELRRQLAKTDGIIEELAPDGVEIIDRSVDISGQSALLQEAKAEIERQAPNPALQGRESANLSGRAALIRQQAGLLELSVVITAFDEYVMRGYRQMWECATQFWTAPKYIRITDDVRAPEYRMVNEPMFQVVQDPETGVEIAQPVIEIVQDPQTGQPMPRQKMRRVLAELDVDIIIDSSPDVASVQEEQFQALTDLFPIVAQSRPDFAGKLLEAIIASSTVIREKGPLIEALNQQAQPDPMQQMAVQLQAAQAQAEIEKTQSETAKNTAQATKTGVEAASIMRDADREEAGEDHASQDRALKVAQMQREQEMPPPG